MDASADARVEDGLKVACRVLTEQYHQEVLNLLHHPAQGQKFVLHLSLLTVAQVCPVLCTSLVHSPQQFLRVFETAAVAAQETLQDSKATAAQPCCIKSDVQAILLPLPLSAGSIYPITQPAAGKLGIEHIDRLVTVQGVVVRAGPVKVLETQRLYECQACQHRFLVEANLELSATVEVPRQCPSLGDEPCRGTAFEQLQSQLHTELQDIRLRQGSQSAQEASAPQGTTAILLGQLVGSCHPGDMVSVTATVLHRWRPPVPGARCNTELVLLVNNLQVERAKHAGITLGPTEEATFTKYWDSFTDRPLAGRDLLVQAVCPQLHGAFLAKLALLLVLIGGIPRTEEGTHLRGAVHMLLLGDTATGGDVLMLVAGKSAMLRWAAKVAAHAVTTSGRGATAAGLMASAVKDASTGSWGLEAGAFVLADGGLCCLDDLDCLKEPDRVSLHEVMEQQTVSVAKAGIVTSLPSRTAVLAACACPRGFKPQVSIAENARLSGPLLSRFDIVLVLRDLPDADWDCKAADHILFADQQEEGDWPLSMLQKYIFWARGQPAPTISPQAEAVLEWYYRSRRGAAVRSAAQTTVRLLQSLVRLAQAHARLMAREEVTQQDAIIAVYLIEASVMDQCSVLGAQDARHASFAADPDADYQDLESHLLGQMSAREIEDEDDLA